MANQRGQQQRLDVYRESLAARGRFQELDDRATAAAVTLVKAKARLAKENPEAFFGLQPTERERFFAEELRVLLREAQAAAPSDGDVDGSNPAILRGVVEVAKFLAPFVFEKLFGGDGDDGDRGPLDGIMTFIKKEKEYFRKGDKMAGDAAGEMVELPG